MIWAFAFCLSMLYNRLSIAINATNKKDYDDAFINQRHDGCAMADIGYIELMT